MVQDGGGCVVELEDITLNAGTCTRAALCSQIPPPSLSYGVRLYISPIGALARVDIVLVPLLLLSLV